MSGAPWPAIAAVSLLAVVGALLTRLRLLLRRPGSVECALRSDGGGGWALGVLHFGLASRRTSVTEVALASHGRESVLGLRDMRVAGLVSWLESAPPGFLDEEGLGAGS